jgi:hypothetical protein
VITTAGASVAGRSGFFLTLSASTRSRLCGGGVIGVTVPDAAALLAYCPTSLSLKRLRHFALAYRVHGPSATTGYGVYRQTFRLVISADRHHQSPLPSQLSASSLRISVKQRSTAGSEVGRPSPVVRPAWPIYGACASVPAAREAGAEPSAHCCRSTPRVQTYDVRCSPRVNLVSTKGSTIASCP